MIFSRELLPKVLTGEKTVTRRKPRNRDFYKLGSVYAVAPARGALHVGHIRVVDVRNVRLGQSGVLAQEEARREGFPDWAAFVSYWSALHGYYDPLEEVQRIEFAVSPLCADCAARHELILRQAQEAVNAAG